MQGIQRVIIVDDDPDMFQTLDMIMAPYGIEVRGAVDEKEFFEIIEGGFKPDYIFLDLEMPSISGWDLLRKMKDDPDYSKIPISILTATPLGREVIESAEINELVDYITKPFTKKEILNSLKFV